MNINWEYNDIGAEGAKAWCAVVSVECSGMYSCHVLDIFFDRNKFCLFGGAVVSSFISDRGELSNM